jgi:hypothetical protein
MALLASRRTKTLFDGNEEVLAELLPELRVGNGMKLGFTQPALLVANPPFGAEVAKKTWGRGLLPRAGVFSRELIEVAPIGSEIRFVLPDVLRSGSHLAAWREEVEDCLSDGRVSVIGRFDTWTDIDVFLLRGRRASAGNSIKWWSPSQGTRVADHFNVRVGRVVPHRDPKAGPSRPYITASEIPVRGEHRAGVKMRRHQAAGFEAPFVAVRRTSRPEGGLVWTIVRSDQPVLVENHLLVCQPNDGTLASCRTLAKALERDEITNWLDQRIRCRHLTVSALREAPYSD